MASARLVGLRILATPLLVLFLILSVVAWMTVSIARGSLFDPSFYLTALRQNHVYDRIYTDVLSDPRSQGKVNDLLGGTQAVSSEDVEQLLRQILPPEYLQQESERNVHALTAYFRKDTNDLVLGVELGPVLDNVRPVAVEYATKRLQSAERQPADSYAAYTARLAEIVDGLKRGEIPDSVPTYEFSEEEKAAALAAILGDASVRDDEKAAIAEALSGGDTAAALAAALDPLLRQRIDESLVALRGSLAPGDVLDLLGQAASDEDTTKAELLSGLEPARNAVWAINTWGVVVAAGIAVLATALLGALYLPSRARALAVAGAALLIVGVLAGIGWWTVRDAAPGRVHDAIIRPDTESPDAERLLAADVARSMVQDGTASGWPPIVAVLLLGGVLVGASFACRTSVARVDPEPDIPEPNEMPA